MLDRALTTALALPSGGAEVAANQWVTSDELGLGGDGVVWAGTVVSGGKQVGLDGWIGGLSVAPKSARDILLERGGNLEWYRSPAKLTTRVSVRTFPGADGVTIEGSVDGSSGGRVTIFRERANGSRQAAGTAQLSGGSFSFTDKTGHTAAPLPSGLHGSWHRDSVRGAQRTDPLAGLTSSRGAKSQPRCRAEPVAHPFPQVELMLALEVARAPRADTGLSSVSHSASISAWYISCAWLTGTHRSSSPCTISVGVLQFFACTTGERASYSPPTSNGSASRKSASKRPMFVVWWKLRQSVTAGERNRGAETVGLRHRPR